MKFNETENFEREKNDPDKLAKPRDKLSMTTM